MQFKIYAIDKDYMDYLRSFEPRIPSQDYFKELNDGHGNIARKKLFKPFIGIVFTSPSGKKYCTQISSKKPRHETMVEDMDFKKIYFTNATGQSSLVAVVNLNYMFPVPDEALTEVNASNIDSFRDFDDSYEKAKYWHFLTKELNYINSCDWESDINSIYNKTNSIVASRCLDFETLEQKCSEWK